MSIGSRIAFFNKTTVAPPPPSPLDQSYIGGINSLNQFNNFGGGATTSPVTLTADLDGNIYYGTGTFEARIGGGNYVTPIFDSATNTIDTTISNYLNDYRTGGTAFNDDMSKAYVIGTYNGYYNGTTFASSGTAQILEINLSNGAVTYIMDLPAPLDPTPASMSMLYTSGKLLISHVFYVALLNISTQTLEWSKSALLCSNCKISGSNFYVPVKNYDGYSSPTVISMIKCSLATGDRDTLFPESGNLSSGYWASGEWSYLSYFDVTSDGKVFAVCDVASELSTQIAGRYFDGTSWTVFPRPAGLGTRTPWTCSFDEAQSKIYATFISPPGVDQAYAVQFDLSGTPNTIITDLGKGESCAGPILVRDNVFLSLGGQQNNPLTGTESSENRFKKYTISGSVATPDLAVPYIYSKFSQGDIQLLQISGTKSYFITRYGGNITGSFSVDPDYSPANNYFAKYNPSTSIFENASTDVLPNASGTFWYFYNSPNITRQIQYSPLQPDKGIIVSPDSIKEFDTAVYPLTSSQNGWPTVVYPTSFQASFISGNYLYVAARNTIAMSDSAGAFNTTFLARINITTKLIDRTFIPSPTYFTGITDIFYPVLSESNNYVYLSFALYSYDTSATDIVRIKKSDDSIQTYSGLPILLGARYNTFASAANGKLIVMPISEGLVSSKSGRPYLVIDEDTLVAEVNQPDLILPSPSPGVSGVVLNMAMNPYDGQIYGMTSISISGNPPFESSAVKLVRYNPVTLEQFEVDWSSSRNRIIPSGVSPNPVVFAPDGSPFVIVFAIINGRRFFGIKKVNSNLTLG